MTVSESELRNAYQRAVQQRVTAARSDCPTVEAVDALAARVGEESMRLATLNHVMACEACRREFDLLRAIHSAGRSARSTIAPRWYAMAAAAVVVVAVSLFALNRDSEPLIRGTSPADSLPALVTPHGDVESATAPQFVWRAVPNATRYTVELLERGGAVRATATLTDTLWQLPDSVVVRRGEELQWWVRAEFPDGREQRSAIARVRVR